jgi:hypothetical protein
MINEISQSSNGPIKTKFDLIPGINGYDCHQLLALLNTMNRNNPYHKLLSTTADFDARETVDYFFYYFYSSNYFTNYLSSGIKSIEITKDNYEIVLSHLSSLAPQVKFKSIRVKSICDRDTEIEIFNVVKDKSWNIHLIAFESCDIPGNPLLSIAKSLRILEYSKTFDLFNSNFLSQYPDIDYELEFLLIKNILTTFIQSKATHKKFPRIILPNLLRLPNYTEEELSIVDEIQDCAVTFVNF